MSCCIVLCGVVLCCVVYTYSTHAMYTDYVLCLKILGLDPFSPALTTVCDTCVWCMCLRVCVCV